jgi:hypothetical protein
MQNDCVNCGLDLPEQAMFCSNCYMPHGFSLDEDRRALTAELATHPLARGYRSGSKQDRNDLRQLVQQLTAKRFDDLRQASWLVMTVLDHLCGYGPLGPILRDPSFRLLLVKDFDRVLVSGTHRDIKAGTNYDSREHLVDELRRLALINNVQMDGENECEFVNSNWNFKISLQPEANGNFLVISTPS